MADAGYEYGNWSVEQAKLQAVTEAAKLAYQYKRMELIDVPMLEIEKDKLALEAAQQAAQAKAQEEQIGLGVLNLVGQLRGPRNAFQQQNVINGIDQQGLSNAVDAIAGRIQAPSFQGMQAQPEPATIGTLIGDIYKSAGLEPPANTQWSPSSTAPGTGQNITAGSSKPAAATPGAQQPGPVARPIAGPVDGPVWDPSTGLPVGATEWQRYSGPLVESNRKWLPTIQGSGEIQWAGYNPAAHGAPQLATYTAPSYGGATTSAKAYNAALPDPQKIVGREWLKLTPDTQDFLLSAYENKGYSGNDVMDYLKKGLPQFRAPTFGGVR